jgi:hypothetical protein
LEYIKKNPLNQMIFTDKCLIFQQSEDKNIEKF